MSDQRISLRQLFEEHPHAKEIEDINEALRVICVERKWSLAQLVAVLPDEEQALIIGDMDPDDLAHDWAFWLRPNQTPPDDTSWKLFAFVGGRGVGKTYAGSCWINKMATENPGCRIALVARTAADVRDTLIEGDSGIINTAHPLNKPEFIPSKRRVVWPNGSFAIAFTSEEPGQLRGPQFHYALGDEIAAWRHTVDDSGLNAWDNLNFATRLGDHPQIFVMTTPKRTPFMLDLLERAKDPKERIIISRGSTFENKTLSKDYIRDMKNKYKNDPKIAEQELHGNMLEAEEGALWGEDVLKDHRLPMFEGIKPSYPLTVIAVDPTVAEDPTDECGIVVVGATKERRFVDRHAYVIEDATVKGEPDIWARRVVQMYRKYNCPVIVEVNQGGALVKSVLHAIDPNIPILEVVASKGKRLRAEPVSLVYKQGRVHHLGVLAELEDQMITWLPQYTKKSPDRVDALVYAVTALLIKPPRALGSGNIRAKKINHRKINPKRRGR